MPRGTFPPGEKWASVIVGVIEQASVMVLVLSESSNTSEHVAREVHLAVDKGVPIFLLRTAEFDLSADLEYDLATRQYVDVGASRGRFEEHVLLVNSEDRTRPLETWEPLIIIR